MMCVGDVHRLMWGTEIVVIAIHFLSVHVRVLVLLVSSLDPSP